MKNRNRKKNMQSITVLLFVTTTLVWLALIFLKAAIWTVDGESLVEDIISNILGILPPMIIFNFLYEYLTKVHMADEMAEQITTTLMGKPEILTNFTNDQQVAFVTNTVEAIVGQESAEMVNAVVLPYITNRYNVRRFFKYSITLRDYTDNALFSSDKYMKVYENLKFQKTYISSEPLENIFHISFLRANHELDSALRKQTYIFQENLLIDSAEIQALLALSSEEQMAFAKDEMRIMVYIDGTPAKLCSTSFGENGLDVELHSDHSREVRDHSIEISFTMPQKKGHSEFFVSVNEPTFSPMIQLSYPEDSMQVKAFSFLNDGDESSLDNASHSVGCYEFCIQDKWIYPVSGVVFTIDNNCC